MRGKYFDIERDEQFLCFCQACLTGKPESERSSKDARYCLECQPLIEGEYKIRGEKYIPVPLDINIQTEDTSQAKSSPSKTQPIETSIEKEKKKMSTLNSPSLKVDNFRPGGRPKIYRKLQLPDDKIKQLHQEGLGAKAIASQLERERGIDVSYKTIQRVLSGERR